MYARDIVICKPCKTEGGKGLSIKWLVWQALAHFNKRTLKFHSMMRQNGVFRVRKKLLRYCKALEEERRKKKEERRKKKERKKERKRKSSSHDILTSLHSVFASWPPSQYILSFYFQLLVSVKKIVSCSSKKCNHCDTLFQEGWLTTNISTSNLREMETLVISHHV